MNIQVHYAVNVLADIGRIKMENRIANVYIESDINDESMVTQEVLQSLSEFDEVPINQIKILGLSLN
ncbi:hypothetical protein [Bacillus sp. FJAT-26390]|uniref:hypothetical protein n=1 Tax=Bacillus sp. FJAT-26390 TaxID=1743142 RepID=UPI000807FCEE|nr:hypothetical protein [Bacillus sp. FJAT-26390]OBZ10881.1 hypothetical protein A7975_17920 [Bacillus sp. FJAT-26390]